MRKLVGLFAGAAILVAACGGTSPSPSASAEATPTPEPTATVGDIIDLFGTKYAPEAGKDGGQVIIGDWQEATQFNPFYYGQVTEANVASLVWHGTLVITSDFRYAPQLAAEPIPTTANGGVKVPGDNGDAMTVTWKLRDGLKWSDGEPLDCDDFKYSWEWVLDPNNVGVVTAGYEDVSAIDCPTGTEMVVHFKNIYEGYLGIPGVPLPRHFLSTIPVADQVNGAGFRPEEIASLPVSGPFKFESVTPQAELRLAKNPNFQNPKNGNKPAYLDRIIFKWYGDPDTMIAGYEAGEIDVAFDLQDSDIPKVEKFGSEVSAIPALLYEFLRPNWSDASQFDAATGTGGCSRNPAVQDRGTGCPVADPAIRQAISFAIDKNEINTRLLFGNAQVANTNISPAAWFYADQAPATYDPAKANEILDAAGWTKGADGIREKGGLKAKIELCTTTRQVRQDTLALIAGWLKDVGIDSVLNPVSPADIFADYNEGTIETPCILARSNFDLAEHAFSSSIDPLGNYFSYHSSQNRPDGANDAQVNDPDIDKALDDVKNNVDFAIIKEAMATFQKVYVEKIVEIPLYYRKNVELYKPTVGNFSANGTQAGSTWNGEDWFVKS